MLHILKNNGHTVTTVCDVHLKDRIDKYFDNTLDDNYDSFVVYAKCDNVITNCFYVHLNKNSSLAKQFSERVIHQLEAGKCHLEVYPYNVDGSFMCSIVDLVLNLQKKGKDLNSIEPLYSNLFASDLESGSGSESESSLGSTQIPTTANIFEGCDSFDEMMKSCDRCELVASYQIKRKDSMSVDLIAYDKKDMQIGFAANVEHMCVEVDEEPVPNEMGHIETDAYFEDLRKDFELYFKSLKRNSILVYSRSKYYYCINFLYVHLNRDSPLVYNFIEKVLNEIMAGKWNLDTPPYNLDGSFVCSIVDLELNKRKYGLTIKSIEPIYTADHPDLDFGPIESFKKLC